MWVQREKGENDGDEEVAPDREVAQPIENSTECTGSSGGIGVTDLARVCCLARIHARGGQGE